MNMANVIWAREKTWAYATTTFPVPMFLSSQDLTNQFACHCYNVRILLFLLQRWISYPDIPFSVGHKSVLENKVKFLQTSQIHLSEINCLLPEQKKMPYHRTNGYEQLWVTGRYFSGREEMHKTSEQTLTMQRFLWKVLWVILYIYTKTAGLLGSFSSWAC